MHAVLRHRRPDKNASGKTSKTKTTLMQSALNTCNYRLVNKDQRISQITDHFVNSGSTVNLCTLDLSEAFDKVNHHALFLKLMQRRVPAVLLILLENMLLHCYRCAK